MHERVIELDDPGIGLLGFLALHTTKPGPAHGGTRIASYPTLEAGRADALRLSEAMTWKCLVNDLPGGGGKVVLQRDAIRDRTAVLRALGDLIESLGGRFFTGTDVGTTGDDIAILRERTRFVAAGEMSREAAAGVLHAVRAACEFTGRPIRGLRVAIQGLGAVGFKMAQTLLAEGAEIVGTDTDEGACRRASEIGVRIVPTDEILGVACDLLSPCAMGGVLDENAALGLRCRMVVGGANNQLADDAIADLLHERDILYVPDFLANSGATIKGVLENVRGTPGTDEEVAKIRDRTLALLQASEDSGVSPLRAALDRLRAHLEALPPR